MESKQIINIYNSVAVQYDNMYSDDKYSLEDETIRKVLSKICRGSMLDIGCGTGYVLDQLKQKASSFGLIEYTGVDISDEMIRQLRYKYEKPGISSVCDSFLEWETTKTYDTIVSTFASMSYMDLEIAFDKVKSLCKDDTLVMLMYYGPDRGKPDLAGTTDVEYSTDERPQRADIYSMVQDHNRNMYAMDGEGRMNKIITTGKTRPLLENFSEKWYIVTNFPIDIAPEHLQLIYNNKRTFAKTMPRQPHFYLVYEKVKYNDRFRPFAEFIRSIGYISVHGKTRYTYANVGNYCYRTMGNPINDTTIINRAIIKS